MFTIIGAIIALLAARFAWNVGKFMVQIMVVMFILDLLTGGFAILVTIGGALMILLSPIAIWKWWKDRPKRLAQKAEEEAFWEERRRKIEAQKKGLWYY